ncbi:hypothetical protein P5V15_000416 [Pogonomyrmex californicus]
MTMTTTTMMMTVPVAAAAVAAAATTTTTTTMTRKKTTVKTHGASSLRSVPVRFRKTRVGLTSPHLTCRRAQLAVFDCRERRQSQTRPQLSGRETTTTMTTTTDDDDDGDDSSRSSDHDTLANRSATPRWSRVNTARVTAGSKIQIRRAASRHYDRQVRRPNLNHSCSVRDQYLDWRPVSPPCRLCNALLALRVR